MGLPKPGEVIVIRFPFSDLSTQKLRPALVVALSDFNNIIVAQITSKLPPQGYGIELENEDFVAGNPLKNQSYIRYNKIFTADPKLVVGSLGYLNNNKRVEVNNKLIEIFKELKAL